MVICSLGVEGSNYHHKREEGEERVTYIYLQMGRLRTLVLENYRALKVFQGNFQGLQRLEYEKKYKG